MQATNLLKMKDLVCAIVVNDEERLPSLEDARLPLFGGNPPGAAETLLIDREEIVRLETFGLPPLAALRALSEPE